MGVILVARVTVRAYCYPLRRRAVGGSKIMEPKVAGAEPIAVELEAGEEMYWCTCGLSANQPYCDGSHAGSDFRPQLYAAEETGTAYLCTCKQTKTPPLCDGSHSSL